MSLKHTYTTSIRSDAGTGISGSEIIESNTEANINVSVPAGDIVEVDLAVDVSQIKSFYATLADDGFLYTNGSGTALADEYFELSTNRALWWNENRPEVCPLTIDVTSFFVENTGDAAAVFKASFLVDLEA